VIVRNPRILRLEHGVTFLASAPAQSVAAAASQSGDITLWRPGCATGPVELYRFRFARLLGISVHLTQPILAVVEETGVLSIHTFDAHARFRLDPSEPNDGNSSQPGFHDCMFDGNGEHLWCTNRVSETDIEIQLRRVGDMCIETATVLADVFHGGGWATLHPSGARDAAVLWLSNGQGESQVYWLTNSPGDGLRCEDEPNVENYSPPVFSPSGEEFLTVGLEGLCRYRWSKQNWGQSLRCPGQPTDAFAHSLAYLDETRALAGTHEGRVYLIDAKRMRVLDEVICESHKLQTRDSQLADVKDKVFGTDLSSCVRIGNCIAFAFAAREGSEYQQRDDLLVVDVETILNRSA
jgi:hypothetical protein